MSQKEENFHHIDDTDSGIFRELGEGLTTRIFPGQQAMISVVRVAPNAKGAIHSHEQEQWGYLISGSAIRIQDGEEIEVGGNIGRFLVFARSCGTWHYWRAGRGGYFGCVCPATPGISESR